MPHLARITRKEPRLPSAFPRDGFPFAAAAELRSLGSADLALDDSLAAQRALADTLRLAWTRRTRVGFFLRLARNDTRNDARNDARNVREEAEAGLRPVAWREVDDRRGAEHVDEAASAEFIGARDVRSHGESFFELFESNLFSGGLYLLDEPEAPLSPQPQLAFLVLMHSAVRDGGQFVIATHSPILLAYPGARIYGFDSAPVREVAFEELDHVTTTRDFLNDRERYLRHLLS